jgi:predicted NUDIX family NTP pyrophosphohydrolase
MAKARSAAGLLMYRRRGRQLEVLLVHHGGPFWRHKDTGAWSVPKGEIEPQEDPLDAARREFEEETGITPAGPYHDLGQVRQKAGKVVRCWAFEGAPGPGGDVDLGAIRSNSFTLEWPPGSGATREFPEIDQAAFFDLEAARQKIIPAQAGLLDALLAIVPGDEPPRSR